MDFRDSNSSWWDHSCFVSCYVGLRSKTAGLSSDKPRLRIRLDGEIMETSRSWTREDFRNREQVIICSATRDHFFFSLVHLDVNNQLICRLFLSTKKRLLFWVCDNITAELNVDLMKDELRRFTRRRYDPFTASDYREISLSWVHIDEVKQKSSVYVYLLVKVTIYWF